CSWPYPFCRCQLALCAHLPRPAHVLSGHPLLEAGTINVVAPAPLHFDGGAEWEPTALQPHVNVPRSDPHASGGLLDRHLLCYVHASASCRVSKANNMPLIATATMRISAGFSSCATFSTSASASALSCSTSRIAGLCNTKITPRLTS